MARVCLCINQIAQLRNLNKSRIPDPISAAIAAEVGGIDGITAHLRDDRADVTDRDITVLKEVVQSHLNLGISLNDEMIKKALNWLPDMVTLLPPGRENNLGESLDIVSNLEYIQDVVATLRANNMVISALIEPDPKQLRAAVRVQLDYVQLNTYSLSRIEDLGTLGDRIELLRSVALTSQKIGLGVMIGRGLSLQNVRELSAIPAIEEFNVGRALIARSLMVGIERAATEFKQAAGN